MSFTKAGKAVAETKITLEGPTNLQLLALLPNAPKKREHGVIYTEDHSKKNFLVCTKLEGHHRSIHWPQFCIILLVTFYLQK